MSGIAELRFRPGQYVSLTGVVNGAPMTRAYSICSRPDGNRFELCLNQVDDELVHETFANYDRLGKDQPKEAGSALRRAFLLSFSPETRYTLGQFENVLDFLIRE